MNKIESDIDGVIERILVQNGDPVEYDEVLFLISQ
jgi:biotin carboxyl carrier protein